MAHSPNSEIVETNPFTNTKKSAEWSKNKVNNYHIQIKPRTQISFVGEEKIWVRDYYQMQTKLILNPP